MSGSPHALFAEPKDRSQARFAHGIVALFILAGCAWILFSDLLLYAFVGNERLVARLETAKGWAFVLVSALFLNALIQRNIRRFMQDRAAMGAVVQSIGDGLLILGTDRTVKHANPAALRMLRAGRASEIVGLSGPTFVERFRPTHLDGSLIGPDDLVSQRVFREGGPLHHTIIIHPPGGEELVIAATAAPVRERPGDTPELVVSVMHDVTAPYTLERLRTKLYAATAHSLKTPVAVIKSHAQLLCKTGAAPEPAMAAIVRQCDRIARLVHNVLVMSRIDSGSLELHMSELELAPVVRRVGDEMDHASPKHHVRVETAGDVRVLADEERLSVLISDLIDVAIRSSADDSTVTVMLRRADGHAEIGVRYLPGAADSRMDAAYEEFDDLGISRRVAAGLVAAHGGELREESSAREKTTWARLPAAGGAP